jgi:hypothetical protein
MTAPDDAPALKKLLSPLLLGIEGVSGLGVPGGRLTVYLEAEDADVRHRVEEVIGRLAPGTQPLYEVTGPFRKQ